MTIPIGVIDIIDAPERWEPPTLKSVQQIDGNPLVQCRCGRSVNVDMMRPLGDSFACDACHETLFRSGQLTREEFAVAHGAPLEVVAKARQIDTALSSAKSSA